MLDRAEKLLRAARVLKTAASVTAISPAGAEQRVTCDHVFVDRYGSSRIHGPQVVLLHGLTSRGARDLRLVRLARALAREHVTCWVPELSGLARYVGEPQDIEAVARTIALASRSDTRQVSILGFSLGGGYGLIAASRRELAPLVHRVTAVGAHHDFDEVRRASRTTARRVLERLDQATEDELWCVLVCARQNLSVEQLGEGASAALDDVLGDYCEHADLGNVRRLIRAHLLPHRSRLVEEYPVASSAELSPASYLASLPASVALLHAPDDTLVPVSHAERNLVMLRARVHGEQSLLVTRLLEHVRPRWDDGIRGVPRLIDCFARML